MKSEVISDVNENTIKQDILTSTPHVKRQRSATEDEENEDIPDISHISSDTSSVSSGDSNSDGSGDVDPVTFINNTQEPPADVPNSVPDNISETVTDLQRQLEEERKLRKRAEDWADFLERELDAQIESRKESDERFFKQTRKMKIYRQNYNKLKACYDELKASKEAETEATSLSLSRQTSVVGRQDSEEIVVETQNDNLTEKFHKMLADREQVDIIQQDEKQQVEEVVDCETRQNVMQSPPVKQEQKARRVAVTTQPKKLENADDIEEQVLKSMDTSSDEEEEDVKEEETEDDKFLETRK